MVRSECALCGEKKELQESHILPKFFLSEYEKRAKEINPARKTIYLRQYGNPNQRVQDIHKQKLLCRDCEKLFAKYEKKLKEYLYDGKLADESDILYGLLSIAWRHIVVDLLESPKEEWLTEEEKKYLKQITDKWREILCKEKINEVQITFYKESIKNSPVMREIRNEVGEKGFRLVPFADSFAPQVSQSPQELYFMLYTMDDLIFMNYYEKQRKEQLQEAEFPNKKLLSWRLKKAFIEEFKNSKQKLNPNQSKNINRTGREELYYKQLGEILGVGKEMVADFQMRYNDKNINYKDIVNYCQAIDCHNDNWNYNAISKENFTKLCKLGGEFLKLFIFIDENKPYDKIQYKKDSASEDYDVSCEISYCKETCTIVYSPNITIDVSPNFFELDHLNLSPIDYLLQNWKTQLEESLEVGINPQLLNDKKYTFEFFCKYINAYEASFEITKKINKINLDQ